MEAGIESILDYDFDRNHFKKVPQYCFPVR